VLRFRLKDVEMFAAEERSSAGQGVQRGDVRDKVRGESSESARPDRRDRQGTRLTVHASAMSRWRPSTTGVPRVALVHTGSTQAEGWFRIALDSCKSYEYISDQDLRRTSDLRAKYDVILLGRSRGAPADCRGNPDVWGCCAVEEI